MKFRVNSMSGHYYVEITPDSEPDEVQTVFSCGNCHSFALAVNKLTSWPLYACFSQDIRTKAAMPYAKKVLAQINEVSS